MKYALCALVDDLTLLEQLHTLEVRSLTLDRERPTVGKPSAQVSTLKGRHARKDFQQSVLASFNTIGDSSLAPISTMPTLMPDIQCSTVSTMEVSQSPGNLAMSRSQPCASTICCRNLPRLTLRLPELSSAEVREILTKCWAVNKAYCLLMCV